MLLGGRIHLRRLQSLSAPGEVSHKSHRAAAVVGKKPSHVAACYVVAPSTVSGSLASGWSFRWLHIAILTTFSSGRWAMGMHFSVLLVASMPDPATTAFGRLVAGLLALGYARLYW